MNEEHARRIAKLRQAYEAGILDEDTYQSSLAALAAQNSPPTANAENRGIAVAKSVKDSNLISGDDNRIIFVESGAKVVFGEEPVDMSPEMRNTALGRYLHHLISHNRYLQLQGIRSGGKLVHIELDRIYIRLRATQQRVVEAEERWLAEEATLAPGELHRLHGRSSEGLPRMMNETVTVAVEEALKAHKRLVVLGDPGSGKTTLLRYLALLYARDLAEATAQVQSKLLADEPARLPILLPLRQVGSYLQRNAEASTEGHARLLEFLLCSLKEERIALPEAFFDEWLTSGKAVILLDGLDEVADPELRRRVARLVESFTQAYADCRFVVTSRVVGYAGASRLGEEYVTTTVRDFTLADVEQFLRNWHRLVAVGLMGAGANAAAYAAEQTRQLLEAIENNPRIRDLAINPLMLTVIAMVHRDRVKLPDRRAELYAEAVDVLLGKWEEAKGVQEVAIVPGQSFDAGDRKLLLQSVALHMHESQRKEIDLDELRLLLHSLFAERVRDEHQVAATVERFLQVIEERTGLLVARGEGIYAFSHLTFQEYLAALAVADQQDYIEYSLQRSADPWWREVILLEAGYLSTQGQDRTSRLIRAIAERVEEPAPYHNLVLAAECLRDVGSGRVQGNLEQEVQRKLRLGVETPPSMASRWLGGITIRGNLLPGASPRDWIHQRSRAMEALVQIGAAYWITFTGEPEWITIPAGEFWIGGSGYFDSKPVRSASLESFAIARSPITNAQYSLFTQSMNYRTPEHWEEKLPPKTHASHPVVNVCWHDALAYCDWLSQKTSKRVMLPSEAQWERAARGNLDKRIYPWGEKFDVTRCNTIEAGIGTTTPVGIFPEGASTEGCLDMVGNVWEWTLDQWRDSLPDIDNDYQLDTINYLTIRGGSFAYTGFVARCASHLKMRPTEMAGDVGFRVIHCGDL